MAKAPPAVVETVAKDWVPLLLAYVDSRTYAADGEVDSAVGVSGPFRGAETGVSPPLCGGIKCWMDAKVFVAGGSGPAGWKSMLFG